MKIAHATVLVTGAGRGLGHHFAAEALRRGADRVYATARHPESITLDGVERLRLDVTDPATVARAAALASDVDLVINNAGVSTGQNLLTGDPDRIRAELDTHFWGTLEVLRAFAPVLGRNGGGAVLNVLSILSFRAFPGNGAYAAAKAAAWSLTNSARLELAAQGTQVTGLHFAATDTDMMAGWDVHKNDPVDIVRRALDGLEAGRDEVLADEETRALKATLAEPPEVLYAPFRAVA